MTYILYIYRETNRYPEAGKTPQKAQQIDAFLDIHDNHETTKVKGGKSTRVTLPNSIQLGLEGHLLCVFQESTLGRCRLSLLLLYPLSIIVGSNLYGHIFGHWYICISSPFS